MFHSFDIDASSLKAVLLDGEDRMIAGAGLSGQARGAAPYVAGGLGGCGETFPRAAARAATVAVSPAAWRRLACFAKEISQ